MCGRFTLAERLDQLKRRFGIKEGKMNEISFDYQPNYNIAPTNMIITITLSQREKKIVPSTWGIPYGERMIINARSDKMASSNMYTELIQSNRCLIPASGFFEWVKAGTRKIPYYITSTTERVMSFAGFFQRVNNIDYTSIITTSANDHITKIHNRMPVILSRQEEDKWLRPENTLKDVLKLLNPYPAELTQSYIVSSRVNNVKNNSPALILPKRNLSRFL